MKMITTMLCAVVCLTIAGCTTKSPRIIIEKHLGLSPAGATILDEALSQPQDNPPDIGLLLHKLSELKQDRNLTLGIFLMQTDEDLMVTNLMSSVNPAAQCRAVLSNNTTSAGSTLVRPEDISNIIFETNHNGRIIGRFDWSVPGLIKGTSRFIVKGDKLEYLGVLRKNPVGIYDCETIFSRHGNLLASQQWIQTKYFVVLEPASQRTKHLSRTDRQKELLKLFRYADMNSIGFAHLRDKTLPLVCVADRNHRDKVIELLKKSDDWKVGLSGRAVGALEGPSLNKSIEKQIREVANK